MSVTGRTWISAVSSKTAWGRACVPYPKSELNVCVPNVFRLNVRVEVKWWSLLCLWSLCFKLALLSETCDVWLLWVFLDCLSTWFEFYRWFKKWLLSLLWNSGFAREFFCRCLRCGVKCSLKCCFLVSMGQRYWYSLIIVLSLTLSDTILR